MRQLIFVWSVFCVTLTWTTAVYSASGDLIVEPDTITFSDNSPVEGDAISISAILRNQGSADINEDIEVRFVEGDPNNSGLQIGSDAIVLGLKAGASGTVGVKWRAAPGRTKIYVIADPDDLIKEANDGNNTAIKLIKGKEWKGTGVTGEQIREAIKKGLDWLRTQQGEFYVICPAGHANFLYSALAYGKCVIDGMSLEGIEPKRIPEQTMPGGWMAEIGPGMTALVVMTFLHAGVNEFDPAVSMGIDHLLNKAPVKPEEWTDPYDHALGILAFIATGNKERYKALVEHSINRLEALQTKDGGWGYGTVADAAHLQYVISAFYAAKQWGIKIKPETWARSAVWITSMQRPDGGWNYYASGSGPFANDSYGSMTATAVMGLKAAGISPNNESVRRGMEWLEKHYSITRNPGSFYWHYYYLLALQRAMDLPPVQEKLGRHHWYSDITSYLISRQQDDGSWVAATPIYTMGSVGQAPTTADWAKDRGDIMATSFAILFLSRVVPKPTAPDPDTVLSKRTDVKME